MTYNLFIAYDLNNQEKPEAYTTIAEAIKELGTTAVEIQKSLWFVHSEHAADDALNYLKNYVDQDDYLIVIEASYTDWTNLLWPGDDVIKNNWTTKQR